jgi:hypothetical protein
MIEIQIGSLAAKWDTDREEIKAEMKAMQDKMEADQEKMAQGWKSS